MAGSFAEGEEGAACDEEESCCYGGLAMLARDLKSGAPGAFAGLGVDILSGGEGPVSWTGSLGADALLADPPARLDELFREGDGAPW